MTRALRRSCVPAALCVVALLVSAGSALAAGPTGAWWHLTQTSVPTNIAPGGEGTISVLATNLGDAEVPVGSTPIKLTLKLPPGVEATGNTPPKSCVLSGKTPPLPVCGVRIPKERNEPQEAEKNVPPGPIVKCSLIETEGRKTGAECILERKRDPYEGMELAINVKVSPTVAEGTASEVPEATIESPGAPTEHSARALDISSKEPTFGVESYEFLPENESGGAQTQAGSHPFQLTTDIQFNRILSQFANGLIEPSSPELVKNVHVNLPPGFIGNPNARNGKGEKLTQCTSLDFATLQPNDQVTSCPQSAAIGVAVATLNEPHAAHAVTLTVPLFNLEPSEGEPARFGFVALGVPVTIDAIDRGGDFHVVAGVSNTSQDAAILGTQVTIWGTPGDTRHDNSRGNYCLAEGHDAIEPGRFEPHCEPLNEAQPAPFLTMPTQCEHPLTSSVDLQSWLTGAPFLEGSGAPNTPLLTGCEKLLFTPSLTIKPEQHASSTPTGLGVELAVPQAGLTEVGGLAEANLRDTKVEFPPGVQLSASAADGLQSCSLAQIGWKGKNPVTGTEEFTPEVAKAEIAESEETAEEREHKCPQASKIGTVEITTPLLENPLVGNIYIAAQHFNPFGSLFGVYIVVDDPHTGVIAKLAGEVKLDETTGQVTSVFNDAPQLPFEKLKLNLIGGPRASLATPRKCGSYSSTVAFTPWSGTPAVGDPDASALNFEINSGPEGGPCPGATLPFSPQLVAGMENPQAGAFSPFDLTLIRPGGEQEAQSLTVNLPGGIAGIIANVEQCAEAQANAGTCGPNSQVGTATALAGLGSDPFQVTGGKVYLTGPYAGAPFGLSVMLPAVAGPFNFGNVVTRSAIFVNKETAAITIVSHLPTKLETVADPYTGEPDHPGIPVQLRRVDVHVTRPEFQFNPTNCSPQTISATVGGDEGATSTLNQAFQAQGCSKLAFSPTLEAEVEQNWTKVEGTGLKVTVRAFPGQANIGKTKIVFPEQLPSRLTTIQKACPEATFNANPASCPEGSNIGTAIAHTPVLKHPLVGPAYLVSHGNAAFPDAEFVLQGENGLVLVLDGQTDIKGPKGEKCALSKTSCVTSSTFNAVPDAPVSTFEVILPRGPHSAFIGYGELCHASKAVTVTKTVTKTITKKVRGKRKKVKVKAKVKVTQNVSEELHLPTTLTGQNGNVIEESLPLKVSGCGAVKSFKKAAKPKKKTKKKKSKKKKKH
ncbi:MAG TPA: hypothetical protein VHT27_11705 [Solirubrobacteraceae bacterium]|jgi:hypothetical protein|nr:hypothetical protein [Solirubrobacteraceae bacterium]